jgi:hypothetical protein
MVAAAAAIAVLVALTLPHKHLALESSPDGAVPGILHVHTNRSDGSQSVDEVAAAAARAGLRFVVFTDHGDATRKPDPAAYRGGVLCIDGTEISTSGGHYIAIDMAASPYPLGGEPRDVVDDVRRLGGFGVVAHPDSPKPELQWTGWRAPFDGIETLNLDTDWRRLVADMRGPGIHARLGAVGNFTRALVDYPFRPTETMARMVDGMSEVQGRIAAEMGRRRVVTVAGADAHANLALRGDPGESRLSLPIPGYEPTFRTLSVRVRPERPLGGDAAADAAMIVRALRNGHLYTAIDGLAAPPSFEFTATNSLGTVRQGDEISVGGPVSLHVRSNAPAGFTTRIHRPDGVVAERRGGQEFTIEAPGEPAVYWVEISADTRPPVVWLRSNPIYVRSDVPDVVAARTAPTAEVPLFVPETAAGKWHIEHDPPSRGEFEVIDSGTAKEMRLRWGLSGGALAGQYVALIVDTPNGVADGDRIAFIARAERPMRISVQLRGNGSGEERWQRSVFVPVYDQDRTVSFDDLTAIDRAKTPAPDLTRVRSVLFVIDTTNTRPGTYGRLWIKSVRLQR